jgi:chemotaxis methyl-accepting protein methylase
LTLNRLNRRLFDLAPAAWVGRHIYSWRARHQPRTQSTTTRFFRNLQQIAALEEPLLNLTRSEKLSVLVAGCSYGCEAYSLGGFLALRFPRLNWGILGVDISAEALKVADAARYTAEYGLGSSADGLAQQITARLLSRSDDGWTVVKDVRERVRFAYGDVLSPQFEHDFKNYDLVLGQNFMIHMNEASAEIALASLVAATRSGGVLFLGGMDLESKVSLLASHELVPLDWNIMRIHEEDDIRRAAWPWRYWSLEPIRLRDRDRLTRYSTIFLKP